MFVLLHVMLRSLQLHDVTLNQCVCTVSCHITVFTATFDQCMFVLLHVMLQSLQLYGVTLNESVLVLLPIMLVVYTVTWCYITAMCLYCFLLCYGLYSYITLWSLQLNVVTLH